MARARHRSRSARLLCGLVGVLAALGAGSCSRGAGTAADRAPTTAPPSTTVPAVSTAPQPAASPPCSPAKPPPSGQTTVTLSFGGVARDYLLYVPASYTGVRAVPVVFDFHGYGSNAAQQMLYGDFRPLADRDGFLVVAPDGVGDSANRHFNIAIQSSTGDDVAFTLAILDQLEGRYCVEARRVYASGMSDGGAMTSVLACRAADRFAAFGPVAVVLYSPNCASGRPVAIAAFMGTADPIVPFNGGNAHCCGSPFVPSAPGTMSGWAAHDGCTAQPVDRQLSSQVVLRQWSACAAGSDVRFYMIQGGGHTWPGATFALPILGLTTHQINASDTLWAFFQAHSLPG